MDQEQRPRLPFTVVGIGASAGGLEPLAEFFKATPPDSGMAFVVVQHLAPDRESLLTEILAKQTPMAVSQVKPGIKPQPNQVYVIAPGRTLTLERGVLRLGQPIKLPARRRPVDDFFRSLAEEQRERAICVILSGMGSNGTAGAQTIKAAGGLCIAQSPESAKFAAMPQALIQAGLADLFCHPGRFRVYSAAIPPILTSKELSRRTRKRSRSARRSTRFWRWSKIVHVTTSRFIESQRSSAGSNGAWVLIK